MKGRCLIIFRVAPAARPAAPPAGPSAALMLGNRSHVLPGPAASKPTVTLAFGFGCQRQGTQLVISPKAGAATAWGAVKVAPGEFTLDELLRQADQVRQREVTKFGSIALTEINTDLFLLNSTPVPMPGTKKTTDTFFIIDEQRAIAAWDEVTFGDGSSVKIAVYSRDQGAPEVVLCLWVYLCSNWCALFVFFS